jgi:nucleoside-diphosphate-sugar epimerase
MSILVTGATGFLGAYLTRQLVAEGFKVRVLYRATSRKDLLADIAHEIDWVEGDILDTMSLEDAMQGITKVYHCAATVSFQDGNDNALYKVNVEGTANVVNTALYLGNIRLLHVSSTAAIGRKENETHINEQSKWERNKINSRYAESKYLAEQEVWRGITEGLDAVIINPAMIIGAGYWGEGTGRLFQRVWSGMWFYTKGTNGFVDVRDVAQLMILLMESKMTEKRFIVCADNWTYQRFFTELAKELHKKPPTMAVTRTISEIAWRLEATKAFFTRSQPLITRETAATANGTYIYNNQLLTTLLNYTYIPLSVTIADTAREFIASKEKNAPFALLSSRYQKTKTI